MINISWKRIEPTIVSKIGWRTIISKTFVQPNGATQHFDTINPENAQFASVIALTPEHTVVIARQFRPGPEQVLDELPGGVVEAGEEPMAAVRRELLEETGYSAGAIHLLGSHNRDAYNNGLWHYFLATDCMPQASQQLDPAEFITATEITIEQLIANAKQGRMTDTHAILLAYDTLMNMNKEDSKP